MLPIRSWEICRALGSLTAKRKNMTVKFLSEKEKIVFVHGMIFENVSKKFSLIGLIVLLVFAMEETFKHENLMSIFFMLHNSIMKGMFLICVSGMSLVGLLENSIWNSMLKDSSLNNMLPNSVLISMLKNSSLDNVLPNSVLISMGMFVLRVWLVVVVAVRQKWCTLALRLVAGSLVVQLVLTRACGIIFG